MDIIIEQAKEKINVGRDLLNQLHALSKIPGVVKIINKIAAEISSLEKALLSEQLTINHILCSNLVYFSYFVRILKQTESVQAVDFPIKRRGDLKSSLRVDIIANNGKEWIKVIARNPKALHDTALGLSNYGSKSILDHGLLYTDAAAENLHCFEIPKIVFDFANPIDNELEESLHRMQIGVRVDGHFIRKKEQNDINISKLNLDVTSMMAFISELTCESCDRSFSHPILNEQAKREKITSTKAFLDSLFIDKELIACETAIRSFLDILDTVGGQNEKCRAKQLLSNVKVLSDIEENEENSVWQGIRLRLGKKIRERTYKIFAFGMYHKALTVTANKRAIDAILAQGISVPSVIHEGRALTEQKQMGQSSPVVGRDIGF